MTNAALTTLESIREQIILGKLAPGSPLSEYQLAEQFGVSRTPVRDALRRLEGRGLVKFVPGSGAFVREFNPRDVVEIVEIRKPLESLVVRSLATNGVPDAVLDRWDAEIDRGIAAAESADLADALKIGRWFHEELIGMSSNGRLKNILAEFSDQIHLIEMVDIRSQVRESSIASMREHREIVMAIRHGDAEKVEQLMGDHLGRIGDSLLRTLLPGANIRL